MPTDVEIARAHTARPITEIAAAIGLQPDDLLLYGPTKAKVRLEALGRPRVRPGPGRLRDQGGRPRDFDITVRSIRINAGAGFLVVLTGDIMRMPGLPGQPQAWQVDLLPDGDVEGLM